LELKETNDKAMVKATEEYLAAKLLEVYKIDEG
jgi:hypothetical protein